MLEENADLTQSEEASPLEETDQSLPQEASEVPAEPRRTEMKCDNCQEDLADYCNLLPFPGPGRIVFLRTLPLRCPFCHYDTVQIPVEPVNLAQETPAGAGMTRRPSGVLLPNGQRPNRQMRRHPENFDVS